MAAKKKASKPERRAVKLNEKAGFPHVDEPTREDFARLAEQAARDVEERQQTHEGKHRRVDGMPFLFAALLRGVTAA